MSENTENYDVEIAETVARLREMDERASAPTARVAALRPDREDDGVLRAILSPVWRSAAKRRRPTGKS